MLLSIIIFLIVIGLGISKLASTSATSREKIRRGDQQSELVDRMLNEYE